MSDGLGSIAYNNPNGSGGAQPPFINIAGARNGTSIDAGSFVVLGQSVGDVTNPAALLNDREIPLFGFSASILGSQTGFVKFDSRVRALTNFFKGTLGQELAEVITIQGQSLAPGQPFGNFWWTLDESFTNPDGQIDAVIQFGYNQSGVGGVVNPNEAAVHWAMESHFQAGGGEQFEIHLQSVAKNGNINRHFSIDISKLTGGAQGFFTANNWQFFADNTITAFFGIDSSGRFGSFGPGAEMDIFNSVPTSGQFRVTTNLDGSVNVGNDTTGGNNIIDFANALVVNNSNPSLDSITVNMHNNNGASGLVVFGTVTGSAFPLFASVNASVSLFDQMVNISATGNTIRESSVAVGSGDPYAIYGVTASDAWSLGMDQSDAHKFKIDLGLSLGTVNFLTFTTTGQGGIGGQTTPTAFLHLPASAGTANLGPLKLTAGPLVVVPEDGLVEYDGTNFFITIGVTRKTIVLL